MTDAVMEAIGLLSEVNGFELPAPEELDLGLEHDAVAAEFGGDRLSVH
jgi:hypothetical protein